MAQPQPPTTRQSGPEAKQDPDPLHHLKPGGPIMPKKQGFINPGPTDRLRGVEPNTSMHRGTPNPEQHGDRKDRNDHSPGMDDNTHGHGVPKAPRVQGRHSAVSKKIPPSEPGDFARD